MEWTVKSDVGVVREENQDRAAVFEKNNIILAILCDGMGGHEGGSYASSLTIEAIKKEFMKNTPIKSKELFSWFKHSLKKSKKLMEKQSKGSPELLDMGTTITIAITYEETGQVYIFNVGDSRTYIYNGLLHQITVDHNLRNYYIQEGGLSPEKAKHILGGDSLTSALGPKKTTRVDAFQVAIKTGIKYLILTSDGIHDFMTKPQFEQIVGSDIPINEIALELIRVAIKNESSDNCTVVIVKVVE
ncbi:MAG: serine/threonine-protein phosphatase [Mycoplasma sp.]|nr:serine/threonine-protein phosphatase [Mycoplasma sp.]